MADPLRVLVIGSDGFLGNSLLTNFRLDHSFVVSGTSRNKSSQYYLDLNRPYSINFEEFDAVIVLASMTSIKACQEQPELAYKTNVLSTISLLEKCVSSGCKVIFMSSNSVFNGEKSFYSVYDQVDPRSSYGQFKVEVERWITATHPNNVSILRLTKVLPENILPPFILRWIDEINLYGFTEVAENHFLSPLSENQVFCAVKKLLVSDQSGLYHCGGIEELSYADFAKAFFKDDSSRLNGIKPVTFGDSNIFNSLLTSLP